MGTLKQEVSKIKGMEIYNKKPYYAKKNVCYRTNSLAELKRIYLYLKGNMKGYSKYEEKIKELHPDARTMRGKNVEWHFSDGEIFDFIMGYDDFSNILGKRKIETFEELSYKCLS